MKTSLTTQPKISIIIAVLNMRAYLEATLQSIIAQNYSNFEIILFDGKSTDGTLDIIKRYERYLAFWRSESDAGHIDACNKALAHVTGDLVTLINADDILLPGALEKVASAFTHYHDAQVFTGGVMIQGEGQQKAILDPRLLQLTLENVLLKLPIINARYFRKEIFERYGKFQASLHGAYYISNDREFLSRLALQNIKSVVIPELLYCYQAHGESLTFSSKNSVRILQEHLWLADKLVKQENMAVSDKKIIAQWKMKESIVLLWHMIKQRKMKEALKLFKGNIVIQPILAVSVLLKVAKGKVGMLINPS